MKRIKNSTIPSQLVVSGCPMIYSCWSIVLSLCLLVFSGAKVSGQNNSCASEFEWTIMVDGLERGKIMLGPGDTWDVYGGGAANSNGQGNGGSGNSGGSVSVVDPNFLFEIPELVSCEGAACGFEAEHLDDVIKIVPVEGAAASNTGGNQSGANQNDETIESNRSWGGGGTAGCTSCQGHLISAFSSNESRIPGLAAPEFSSYVACGGRLMLLFDIDSSQASLLGADDWLKHFRLSEVLTQSLDGIASEFQFLLSNEQSVVVSPEAEQMIIRVFEEEGATEPVSSIKLSQDGDSVLVEAFTGDLTDHQDLAFTFSPAPDFDGDSNLYGTGIYQGLQFTAVRGAQTVVSRHYSHFYSTGSLDETVDPPVFTGKVAVGWSRDEWITEGRVTEKLENLNVDSTASLGNERSRVHAEYEVIEGDEILVKREKRLYDVLVSIQRPMTIPEFRQVGFDFVDLEIANGSVQVGSNSFHELLVEEETNGQKTRHYYDDFDNSHWGHVEFNQEYGTYSPAAGDPRFLKRMATVFPDKSWERYIYSGSSGERIGTVSPFLDNGLLSNGTGQGLSSPLSITFFQEVLVGENGESEIQENHFGDVTSFVVSIPESITAGMFPDYKVENVEESDSDVNFWNDNEIHFEVPDPWSDSGYRGKVIERDSGLGVSNLYSYHYGTFTEADSSFSLVSNANDATHYREISYSKAVGSTQTELDNAVATDTQIDYGNDRFLAGRTTRSVRILEIGTDANQQTTDTDEVFSSSSFWNGSAWVALPESDSVESQDADGNPVVTVYDRGVAQSQRVEVDDATAIYTDQIGLTTTSSYDHSTRTRVSTTAAVSGGTPERTITEVSTPSVLTLPAWLGGSEVPVRKSVTTEQTGELVTSSTQVSDWNGRLLWQLGEGGFIRSVAYEDSGRTTKSYRGNIYLDETATLLGSNARYLDGKAKSQSAGTSVTSYSYQDDSENSQLTTTTNRNGLLSTTVVDEDGQLLSQSRPAADGTGHVTTTYLDTNNDELVDEVVSTDPLTPAILYTHDGLGNQLAGIDVNNDGDLSSDSQDRYTASDSLIVQEDGILWNKSLQTTFSTETESSITTYYSRLSFPTAGLDDYPRLVGHNKTVSPTGEIRETLTRVTGVGEVTTTTTSSAEIGAEVVVTRGGQVVSRTRPGIVAPEIWNYQYTADGLVTTYTDTRGGVTITTSNLAGQVTTVRQPAIQQTLTYQYYPAGRDEEGQLWATTNNAGEVVIYDYDANGRVTEIVGDTYRLSYTYTPGGQVDTLSTYREKDVPVITKWKYQAGTGLLEEKLYDSDADGNSGQGPRYIYHPGGQLGERQWVRGSNPDGTGPRLTTAYSYSSLGDLEEVFYNDGTPAVRYSGHDRLGRPGNVAQGDLASPIHEADFAYSTDFGGVATVSYDAASLLGARELNYGRGSRSVSGAQDITTITAGGGVTEYARTWTAHSQRSASPASIALAGGASATYHQYLEGTGHPQSYSVSGGVGSVATYHQRHFDLGGRVTGVMARSGAATGSILSSAGYKHDAAGRRQWLTREDGTRWEFDYNARGEVTAGKKRLPNNGAMLAGQQFEYDYDGIGNRKTFKFGGDETGNESKLRTINYKRNNLNQYDEISYLGHASLIGFGGDPVDITSSSPTLLSEVDQALQEGDRWWREIELQSPATADGLLADFSLNSNPVGQLWLNPVLYVPEYDSDGNLTKDGRWKYSWNGENRLVAMETNASQSTGQPWMRLNFFYDWQGRRVRKTVETKPDGTNVVLQKDLRFLYDGWNLIAEYQVDTSNSSLELFNSYLWGPDLSGTEQGAGGVGGLLAFLKQYPGGGGVSDESFFPSYDGNGNIIAWVDEAGLVDQRNDYDPFGNLLSKQGEVDGVNFGFSTKYTDEETGLCYYGYRYYDPVTGRWPSRDPIEERGGLNLYGFVGNDGVNYWDYLGLKSWEDKDPLNISFLGFNPTGTTFDGSGLINVGADHTFPSLGSAAAMRVIVEYFDTSGDRKLTKKDCPKFKLNITGYSYGGWTSLQLTHSLEKSYPNLFEIRIGTVDPVKTLRTDKDCVKWRNIGVPGKGRRRVCVKYSAPFNTREKNVVYGVNYYQTEGGAGTPGNVGAGFFVGSSVNGFDVDKEETGFSRGTAHVAIFNRPGPVGVPGVIFTKK